MTFEATTPRPFSLLRLTAPTPSFILRGLSYDERNVSKIAVTSSSADYKVHIGSGLLETLSARLAKVQGKRRGSIFVLTSPEIWALWSKQFLASFPDRDAPRALFLPAGERHKRLSQVERLASELAKAGADRSSLLVAFGGGIIGDVGGFLAAVYMRGIDYIQVPSTFLAQVDSSVGGKTGVNLSSGKNLVGSFHPPAAVFADLDLLGTLPDRELRAGLYESIKAGIIRDKKLFALMEEHSAAILARDPVLLKEVITRSVKMKARVVGLDEREDGLRMILNLGHTVGHAIESETRYTALLHGEAVGWGMLAAIQLGAARGTINDEEVARCCQLIHAYGPLPPFTATAAALVRATARDKKNRSGTRRFVLPQGIGGAPVVEDVTVRELTAAVDWMLAQQPARQPAQKHDQQHE